MREPNPVTLELAGLLARFDACYGPGWGSVALTRDDDREFTEAVRRWWEAESAPEGGGHVER